MDRRFSIKCFFFILVTYLLFTSQTSNTLVCFLTKNHDGSFFLKLSEQTADKWELKPNYSLISFTRSEQILSLKFHKSSISEKDFFTYFATGFFLVPNQAEIELPDGQLHAIKTGRYKISESDLYYEILFD
jgi:hypothetical protein